MCFTLNEATDYDVEQLKKKLNEKCSKLLQKLVAYLFRRVDKVLYIPFRFVVVRLLSLLFTIVVCFVLEWDSVRCSF